MTRLYHGVTKSLNVHNQGINSLFFLVCYTSVNQTDIIHVQACEGCKGFFRRSINQKPVYKPCKAKYLSKFYSFHTVHPLLSLATSATSTWPTGRGARSAVLPSATQRWRETVVVIAMKFFLVEFAGHERGVRSGEAGEDCGPEEESQVLNFFTFFSQYSVAFFLYK